MIERSVRRATGPEGSTRPPEARRPPVWVLILATSLGPFALQALVPAMPGLARDFETGFGVAQMSLTSYLAGMTVGQLAYGPLSDRFGRRPMLLAGLAVFMAGTACCLLARDIAPLIAGRALQALGGAAGVVLARAIVRDLYEREKAAQMIAYVTVGMIVAPMIGPIVGGHLYDRFGWPAVFWFTLAFGVVVILACFALLHETHRARGRTTTFGQVVRGCGTLLRIRRFRGYAFQVAFTTASFFSFLGGASAVAVDMFGRSASDYGWWFVAVSFSYMSGNFVSARIGPRVGSDRMIAIGTVFSLVAACVMLATLLAGAFTLPLFFLLSGAMSIGNGFSMPNGFAGAVSVDSSRAGTASGLSGALQMGTGAVAITIVGYTLADSPLPVVLMMLIMALFAWLAHGHGMRRRAEAGPPMEGDRR